MTCLHKFPWVAEKNRLLEYGLESSSYLGPRLLNILSVKYKKIQFAKNINAKIRSWVPKNCPSQLWKIYIQHVRFI